MKTMTKTENRRAPEQQTTTAPQPQPQRGYLHPPVNVVETQDGYILEAEMPGVGKDGLEVLLENNELTIVGRRRAGANGYEALYRESRGPGFSSEFRARSGD
jgi:HSP20 family protein